MVALEGVEAGGEVDGPCGVDYERCGGGEGGVCVCVEAERRVGESGGDAGYRRGLRGRERVGRGGEGRETGFPACGEGLADAFMRCDVGGTSDEAGYFGGGWGGAEEMEYVCAERASGAGEKLWGF